MHLFPFLFHKVPHKHQQKLNFHLQLLNHLPLYNPILMFLFKLVAAVAYHRRRQAIQRCSPKAVAFEDEIPKMILMKPRAAARCMPASPSSFPGPSTSTRSS